MKRVPQLVRRGKKDRRMGEPSELGWEAIEAMNGEARTELIRSSPDLCVKARGCSLRSLV